HLTRAALSPTHVTWLQPGALLAVANDRGQVQFFDMALSLVRVQLGGEDGIPVRLLDFADYFCHQPSLRHISWAPAPVVFSCSDSKRSANANVKRYLDVCEQHSSMLLMLHYARGPLVCLRFNAPHFSLTHPVSNPRCDDLGSSSISPREDSDPLNTSHVSYASTVSNSSNSSTTKSSTNVHNESLNVTETSDGCLAARENRALTSHYCSISPDVLVGEYLCHGQVEEAINLSRSLCWEQDGGAALKCISNVVNYIIRRGQLSRHISGGLSSAASGGGDLTDKLEDPSLEDKEPGSSTGIAALGLWESRILSAASALSSGFLSPSTALTAATEELYGPPVRALARRLFFKLLRSGCVQPAYSLARDLGDPDCFVRLHRAALRAGLPQLAAASLQRAHSLRSSSSSSSSSCSGSCSDSDWSGSSSSSCCSDDCSHSSYSSSRSCSDTCSTCSDTSDGTDSDDLPEGRGERQGGDGRESEGTGNARLNGAPVTADDVRSRPDRPLYVQQSTSFPPPVPAPILPRVSKASPLDPADSSTMTYYDLVPHLSSASVPYSSSASVPYSSSASVPYSSSASVPYSSSASVPYSSSVSYPSYTSTSGKMLTQSPSVFSNPHGLHNASPNTRTAEIVDQSNGNKFLSGAKPSENFSVLASSDVKSPASALKDRNLKSSDIPYEQVYNSERPHVSHAARDSSAHLSNSGREFVTNKYASLQNIENLHEFSTSSADHSSATGNAAPGVSNPLYPDVDASGTATSPVSAITSQDGKVTINITQDNSHKSTHRGSRHHKSKSKRSETSSANELLESREIVDEMSSSGVEATQSKSVQHGSSKHRLPQKKPDPGGIPFRTRRSQRNLTDAMDAADFAIAALTSSRDTKMRAAQPEEEVHSSFQDPKNSGLPDHVLSSTDSSSSPSTDDPGIPHAGDYNGSQTRHVPLEGGREQLKCHPSSVTQELSYYNEDTIDEELNRSMYQELSTEEEEGGGTVKVVHFGVV
ncbi:WD repeat-containing and planar cell polarity effector protein Fritz, partial [Trinorchestia longiramus]